MTNNPRKLATSNNNIPNGYFHFPESKGPKKLLKDFLHDAPTAPRTGPYFDTAAMDNVTGLVGHTILLQCRVRNLGNQTVS